MLWNRTIEGSSGGSATTELYVRPLLEIATGLQWNDLVECGFYRASVDTEQSAEHPGLPVQVLFVIPSTCPLRIICTASIPAMTAPAVAVVRGPCMARNSRFTCR